VCFIHDQILPVELFESTKAYSDCLVCGNAHVEFSLYKLIFDDLVTNLHFRVELNYPEKGYPFRELFQPIWDGWLRSDDQVGSLDFFELGEVWEDGDRLNGLTKTLKNENNLDELKTYHIIGQNSTEA